MAEQILPATDCCVLPASFLLPLTLLTLTKHTPPPPPPPPPHTHTHTSQTALQLLEKSTHEKQDTIVSLRKQLEEMKSANLKMQTQLQVRGLSMPLLFNSSSLLPLSLLTLNPRCYFSLSSLTLFVPAYFEPLLLFSLPFLLTFHPLALFPLPPLSTFLFPLTHVPPTAGC